MMNSQKFAELFKSCWLDILDYELESDDMDFFEAGLDSINIIYLSEKINRYLDIPIEVHALFYYPTLSSLIYYYYEKHHDYE